MGSVAGMTTNGIAVGTPPSGSACLECDTSPSQHATHFRETGHPVIQSFEPGGSWFWDYEKEMGVLGPELAAPTAHPGEQPTPGPAGRVPADWREHING